MPTGGVDGDSSWARLYDPDPIVIMWEKESLALIRRGLDEPEDEDDETAEEADRWPGWLQSVQLPAGNAVVEPHPRAHGRLVRGEGRGESTVDCS